MNFHEGVYMRIRCIFICVSVFICLYVTEIDTHTDIYNNRSLFFRVTFEVGRKLVSPLLCLTKQVEIHPRELD